MHPSVGICLVVVLAEGYRRKSINKRMEKESSVITIERSSLPTIPFLIMKRSLLLFILREKNQVFMSVYHYLKIKMKATIKR